MLQTEIDARGQEGGCEDETADLDLEGGAEGVGVHHYAANVAETFAEAADDEGDGK